MQLILFYLEYFRHATIEFSTQLEKRSLFMIEIVCFYFHPNNYWNENFNASEYCIHFPVISIVEMSHLMTKPTKWLYSDQPGHPSSLIRDIAVRSIGTWGPNVSSCGQWRLIRLGGCPGWSESSLGAHAVLLVLSWGGSNVKRSPNLWKFGNENPHLFANFNIFILNLVTHGSTVAHSVMFRQDGREWFLVLLDNLSKCRTNKENPNLVRIFLYDNYIKWYILTVQQIKQTLTHKN